MSTWNRFIQVLSDEIDWRGDLQAQEERICAHLLEMYRDRDVVVERFKETIADEALFREYSPHMEYPRPVMDKFILHMDPNDRFRVRLHKFKSARENRGVTATVHDHRWSFFSVLLSGCYREVVYEIISVNEDAEEASLHPIEDRVLVQGSLNVSEPLIPHLTVNDSESQPCFSLFIRGPSTVPYSRIFDIQKNRFRRSWGLRSELKAELALLQEGCVT